MRCPVLSVFFMSSNVSSILWSEGERGRERGRDFESIVSVSTRTIVYTVLLELGGNFCLKTEIQLCACM